jgi:2-methylcitrate synthase
VAVNGTGARGGLGCVCADATAISLVSPGTGTVTYRGYPVQELARRCSFEEVTYLLWHGELPTAGQLTAHHRAERAQRALPPDLAATLTALPATAHPMDTLRTAVSLLGATDPGTADAGAGPGPAALRLYAVLPAVVALDHRRRHGLGPVPPRTDLSYAANYLYMTFGKIPEPQIVAAFQTALILYAEHGYNPSAFTARITAATGAGAYSAVTAAISALKGPRHGGTAEAVLRMLTDIAIPDNARPWLTEQLAAKRPIPGFARINCPDGDPRVPAMRAALGITAALRHRHDLTETYETLAAAVRDAKDLHPTLDYPAAPTLHLTGYDTQDITPIIATARLPGWTAHITEQQTTTTLTRPHTPYNGPPERHLTRKR